MTDLTHNDDGSIDIHIDAEDAERLTDPDDEFWDFEVLLEQRDEQTIDVLEIEIHTWGVIAFGDLDPEDKHKYVQETLYDRRRR